MKIDKAVNVEKYLSEKAKQLIAVKDMSLHTELRSLGGVVRTSYASVCVKNDAHSVAVDEASKSFAEIVNILVEEGWITGIVSIVLIPLARMDPSIATAILAVVTTREIDGTPLSLAELNAKVEEHTYKGCEMFVESGEVKPALYWQRIKEALKMESNSGINKKAVRELPIEKDKETGCKSTGSQTLDYLLLETQGHTDESRDGRFSVGVMRRIAIELETNRETRTDSEKRQEVRKTIRAVAEYVLTYGRSSSEGMALQYAASLITWIDTL